MSTQEQQLDVQQEALHVSQQLLFQARTASRRVYLFFSILWITVVIMMGAGLYTLYDYAQHTNRTLACVLSVAPEEREAGLWQICDKEVP